MPLFIHYCASSRSCESAQNRHSRILLAGIQASSDWTSTKTFAGDAVKTIFIAGRSLGHDCINVRVGCLPVLSLKLRSSGLKRPEPSISLGNLTSVSRSWHSGRDKRKQEQTCFIHYAGDSTIFTTAGA